MLIAKIWPVIGHNLESVQDMRGELVLITNSKSYTSFRFVPKFVTLDDFKQRNGQYFALYKSIR